MPFLCLSIHICVTTESSVNEEEVVVQGEKMALIVFTRASPSMQTFEMFKVTWDQKQLILP